MTDEFSYELKVSKERIAVLIGKQGEVKKDIEDATKSHLDIDSKEGDVTVVGKDALGIFDAREIVRAIGRGFNPEVAMRLLHGENTLEVISLNDYTKAKTHLDRIRGRVIGTGGKTRKIIEEITETSVAVYGKTISIIGEASQVAIARQAVESLLAGSPHASVYRWLEQKRRELKRMQVLASESLGKVF